MDDLTDKQRRIVQRVAAGEDWRSAAKAEGCTDSYARVIGHRLRKKPVVVKMLEAIQSKGREIAAYDLARAMQEAQEVIDFAKLNKNAMAYFKAVEHRAKLSGLLIDKVEVVTVDLKGALTEARSRVFDITPRPRPESLSAVQVLTAAPATARNLTADGNKAWVPFSGD